MMIETINSRIIIICLCAFSLLGVAQGIHLSQVIDQQDYQTTSSVNMTKWCPNLFHRGVLHLDVNPAFLKFDSYSGDCGLGLTVSSFFNAHLPPPHVVPEFFQRDLVGRICQIENVTAQLFDFSKDFEILTDLTSTNGAFKTVWPNEASRIPDGVLPFEALILPQGFPSSPFPGRLTILNLESPTLEEYLVHETNPPESQRSYHTAAFYDMDGDGLKDIVTVRSGLRWTPFFHPPFSELVYFRNPGEDLDPNVQWEEHVLYGGPLVSFFGPDIDILLYDFENSGVPQIVATHFFSVPENAMGKIVLYAAPIGGTWADVNAYIPAKLPRVKVLSEDQGSPMGIAAVDINGDGKVDILATNHEVSECLGIPGTLPGKVFALEQPTSGDLFVDDWTLHVLADDYNPQPNFGLRSMRRSPGHAIPFHVDQDNEGRPWILVSGDQAGRVWMMKPQQDSEWEYHTAVIFDINDYYGENTTQSYSDDWTIISTIGKPAIRYYRSSNERRSIGISRRSSGSSSESSRSRHLKGSHRDRTRSKHEKGVEFLVPVFEAKVRRIFAATLHLGDRLSQISIPAISRISTSFV